MMYNLTKESSWSQRALGAAQQAQRLNDSLPEAHFSLGSIYAATGKSSEAVVELQHALRLARRPGRYAAKAVTRMPTR